MEEEKKWCVYCHENKINGKKYFGITCRKNPKERWLNGKGYKNNIYFNNSIEKYGWSSGFNHIILFENLEQKLAEGIEIYLINKYKSFNKNFGYNIKLGGNVTNCFTNETKKKISESRKKQYKDKSAHPMSIKVVCENITFLAINDCMEYYGLIGNNLSYFLSGKLKMPNKWILRGLRYYNELEDKNLKLYNKNKRLDIVSNISNPVVCEEIIFKSITECSFYYKMNKSGSTICSYLTSSKPMPQKWKDRGLRYYNPETDKDLPIYVDTKDEV